MPLSLPSALTQLYQHVLQRPAVTTALHLLGGLSLFCLLVFIFALCDLAQAAPFQDPLMPSFAFDDMVQLFQRQIMLLHTKIVLVSHNILYYCAAFAFVIAGMQLIFHKNGEVSTFFYLLIRLLLLIGFYQFIITHSYSLARDIINSLVSIAMPQGSSFSLSQSFNHFFDLVEAFSSILATQDSFYFIVFLLAFFACGSFIVVRYITIWLCALWVAVTGVIMVGFGALQYCRSFPLAYIKVIVQYGLKLFTITFIFQLSLHLMLYMLEELQDYTAAGQLLHIQDAAFIVFVMFALATLAAHLPRSLDSVILNSQLKGL